MRSDRLRQIASAEMRGARFVAMVSMAPISAAAILVARSLGVVSRSPLWLIPTILVVGLIFTSATDLWWTVSASRPALHARIASQTILVTATIYATGWGPVLAVGLVLVGQESMMTIGSRAHRAVLGWSLLSLAAGEAVLALGWAPSLLSRRDMHGLAMLMAVVIANAFRSLRFALVEKERSEAHHRAIVENASEGMYTATLDGTIRSFNAAAEAMFGWTATEIIGRPVTILTPLALRDAVTTFLASHSAGSSALQRHDLEISGVRRDGTEFPLMASTSAIAVEGSPLIVSCIARDLSEQKHFQDQLAYQALHDALTGLPNRSKLIEHLDQALMRARRHQRTCGVLFIDLDRFKIVNDTLGHAAGDRLLIETAARIRATVRETDTVARLGGDEFVVLCEDLDRADRLTILAQRIIAVLRAPFDVGNETRISASIGITCCTDGSETPDALIAQADLAMYQAKQNGRDRYEQSRTLVPASSELIT